VRESGQRLAPRVCYLVAEGRVRLGRRNGRLLSDLTTSRKGTVAVPTVRCPGPSTRLTSLPNSIAGPGRVLVIGFAAIGVARRDLG
jgi:hypothetical protein